MVFFHQSFLPLLRKIPLLTGIKRFKIAKPRSQRIWIRNLPQLLGKLKRMRSNGTPSLNLGINELDIVTDYDFTLTKYRDQGQFCQSLFQILSASSFLPDAFRKALTDSYQHYGPYETDNSQGFEVRAGYIESLYKIQKKQIAESHLTRSNIEQILNDSHIVFRYGAKYLFSRTAALNLPVYVISGGVSDLVLNTIKSISKPNQKLSNLWIFSNQFQWQDNQTVTSFQPWTIHSFNKYLIYPDFIPQRRNCILMGDLITDSFMTCRADYRNQISIFYSKEEGKERTRAMGKFDVIVESDESMRFAIFVVNAVAGAREDVGIDWGYVRGCHEGLADGWEGVVRGEAGGAGRAVASTTGAAVPTGATIAPIATAATKIQKSGGVTKAAQATPVQPTPPTPPSPPTPPTVPSQ